MKSGQINTPGKLKRDKHANNAWNNWLLGFYLLEKKSVSYVTHISISNRTCKVSAVKGIWTSQQDSWEKETRKCERVEKWRIFDFLQFT